jgi:hypothetical protein
MQKQYSLKSDDVALVEAIISWWSREMEDRVTLDGWNTFLVTFMFNHIPEPPPKKLKLMQDSVCRFYSKLVTRIVRKPNSIYQLVNRPRMITAPDYPVFKYEKIGLQAATVNDGLHMHSILAVPLKSRLKEGIASHVAGKSYLYIKPPLRNIHFLPIEGNIKGVTDYALKAVKHRRCRWEDVLFLPKSPSELSGK